MKLVDLRDVRYGGDDLATVQFIVAVATVQHAITQMLEALPGAAVARDPHALVLAQRASELTREAHVHMLRAIRKRR